jgi:hypothetical protein
VIPPGGEGTITLRINTRGYERRIRKSAKVNTNDPALNVVHIALLAFVKVPVYLSSHYVFLRGNQGASVTRSIEIRAGLDKPLALERGQFTLQGKVNYVLEEIEKGKRFKISFTNVSDDSGSYAGFLRLETNYPEKPFLDIRIRGRFSKAKVKIRNGQQPKL